MHPKTQEFLTGLPDRLGFDVVARALRDTLDLFPDEVVEALYAYDGIKFSDDGVPAKLARALRDGLDLSPSEVADAIKDAGGSNAEIAKLLHAEDGLGLSVDEVAQVLYAFDGLNCDAETVADALYHGLNLSQEKVAHALREDLKLHPDEVAEALELAGIETEE